MEAEFSEFEVKWLLSAPDINSGATQADFEERLKFRGPFRAVKLDGRTFSAELVADQILYIVNGKTNINANGDMEFYAEGKVTFLGTIFERLISALAEVVKWVVMVTVIIYGGVYFVLKGGPQTDLGQWLMSKDITPLSAVIYVVEWGLVINLICGVLAIAWSISKSRTASKRAGEKVKNWLAEQHFRQTPTP